MEVFEVCNEYLSFTANELKRININSPRFLAVKKGRKKVRSVHRKHLLTWTELESKKFMNEAVGRENPLTKIETARKAEAIVKYAKKFYPRERNLLDSASAISEFITGVKISAQIEKAEREEFNENFKGAIKEYKEALFILTREQIAKKDKDILAENINTEIKRIRSLIDIDRIYKRPDRRIKGSKEND